jgi:ERCC4-related helicase
MFQVMKALWPFNSKFRVLALSATPGSDMQVVKQVCITWGLVKRKLQSSRSVRVYRFFNI